MEELFAWLERLESLTRTGQASISEQMHRIFAPSALDFDGSIVRVVDARQEVSPFGRLPGRLSVLCLPDVGHVRSLEDQAVAAQLGAIFTLATNRRVQVAASDVPLNMEGSTMRTFMPTDLVLDRSLAGPLGPNTQAEIESLLSRLYGLRPDDREVIGAAIELHYAATLLYDVEANAAYALIIAGLERLSRAYGVAPAEWSYWEHAGRLDQAFSELALSKVQINRLRDELLKDQHLRLRQTFAGYVVESLPDEYWQEQIEDFVPGLIVQPNGAMKFEKWKAEPGIPMSRFVPSDRALLRKRLLRSYDVRSSYVHKGTRRAGLTATAAQAVGKKPSTTAPIEFVGVRTMLRTLIFHETTNRTQPITLPKVIMMHGTQRDQT